jgi:hypothetical protein
MMYHQYIIQFFNDVYNMTYFKDEYTLYIILFLEENQYIFAMMNYELLTYIYLGTKRSKVLEVM